MASHNRGLRRGTGLADRYERAMLRLSDLVEVTFGPWYKLPRLVQAVVLLHVGLLPKATDLVRLVESLTQ